MTNCGETVETANIQSGEKGARREAEDVREIYFTRMEQEHSQTFEGTDWTQLQRKMVEMGSCSCLDFVHSMIHYREIMQIHFSTVESAVGNYSSFTA